MEFILGLIKKLETAANTMNSAANAIRRRYALTPQRVRWSSATGQHGTGLRVRPETPGDGATETLIPWPVLKREIDEHLIPRLFARPEGYQFVIGPFHGRQDHLVHIIDARHETVADVWFGVNPDDGWKDDGLVHIGGSAGPPFVWHTYRRLSDGTYERLHAQYRTLEIVPAEKRHFTPFTDT